MNETSLRSIRKEAQNLRAKKISHEVREKKSHDLQKAPVGGIKMDDDAERGARLSLAFLVLPTGLVG